jgi:4-amino-4-deoxy-L-arabinose transferase-like glycosyltransferase
MKKYRELLSVGLIVVAGLLLRAYQIIPNYYFSGELGKEMLYILKFAESKSLPLIGMATSHEWLSYGPVYYWIMIPVFKIFSGDPFILFWTALAVSLTGLIINYAVVKKIADKSLAMTSTFIMASSPLLIWQTRLSKLHVFFWILMPVIMLFNYFLWKGRKKWVLPAGILFGLLFSFHFSQIPLLGVAVLIFWFKKDIYKISDWIKFFIGLLIPNIPLIWQDRNLALWLPYRVVNIANKNPSETFAALVEYFGKNIFWEQRLWFIGLSLFVILMAHYIYSKRKVLARDFLPFYLTSSIGLMFAANILHGASPVHYYLPIFTFVPIFLAIYLSKLKYWPVLLILITAVNLISFFRDPLFYKKYSGNIPGTDIVSYESLNAAASFIARDANGRALSIKRIGPYDHFPENYAQHYKYLVFLKGGNVIDNSGNTYTIIENEEGVHVQK